MRGTSWGSGRRSSSSRNPSRRYTAAIAVIPSSVPLERASDVHLTDAGGGALQWVLHAPSTNWSLQATLWPGSLHLFVHDPEDEEEHLYRARATRDREYYLRKYP